MHSNIHTQAITRIDLANYVVDLKQCRIKMNFISTLL